jgi:hypothetical protein
VRRTSRASYSAIRGRFWRSKNVPMLPYATDWPPRFGARSKECALENCPLDFLYEDIEPGRRQVGESGHRGQSSWTAQVLAGERLL